MNIRKKPIKKGEIKPFISQDIEGVFNDFQEKIRYTNFNLDIFYKNIKNVQLEEVKAQDMVTNLSVAEYNIRYNIIRFLKNSFKIGIMHELFHLASTVVGQKTIYCGFFQQDRNTKEIIGYGLNEAYTALLDDRYFPNYTSNKKQVIGNSYQLTKYLVQQVENCLGEETMEELYSTCDLATLTHLLAKKVGLKDTLKFYRALDNIMINLESEKHCNVKKVLRSYEYACLYTTKLYLDTIDQAYINEEISDNDYEDFLLDLQEQVSKPLVIGKYFKKNSKTIDSEEFSKIVAETMQKSLKKYT